MQRKSQQFQLKLVEEVYKIKQIEVRLKEITDNSSNFRKCLLEVVGLVQIQITWIGANSIFFDHIPQKIAGRLNMELVLLYFCNKVVVRLNTTIEKTVEK